MDTKQKHHKLRMRHHDHLRRPRTLLKTSGQPLRSRPPAGCAGRTTAQQPAIAQGRFVTNRLPAVQADEPHDDSSSGGISLPEAVVIRMPQAHEAHYVKAPRRIKAAGSAGSHSSSSSSSSSSDAEVGAALDAGHDGINQEEALEVHAACVEGDLVAHEDEAAIAAEDFDAVAAAEMAAVYEEEAYEEEEEEEEPEEEEEEAEEE